MPLRLTKHSIRIRLSRDQYHLLAAAAKTSGKSIKEFIICSAFSEAELVLGKHDELHFPVSEATSPTTNGLLNRYDPDSGYAKEVNAWDNIVPVGREFGSPDFEILVEADRVEFQAKLSYLVNECKSTETAKHGIDPANEFFRDAINVQLALKELGQEVSVGVAAAVWEHYSSSLAASWLSGANSVYLARKAIFSHVTFLPPIWKSFIQSGRK